MKYLLKIVLPIILCLTFHACSEEQIDELDNQSKEINFKNSTFENQKRTLKNEEIVNKLYALGLEYREVISTKDFKKIKIIHAKIKKYSERLYNDYGFENIDNFKINLESQIKSDRIAQNLVDESGDKCKRNSDGTVDYDACDGFWENVLVTIRVGFCPDYDAEVLYDCAQAAVCRTC